MTFKFHVERSGAFGTTRLAIVSREMGRRSFVQPLVLKSFDENIVPSDAEAFVLSDGFAEDVIFDFLQAAMDAAWDLGIRPAQAKDMTAEVAAVRYHLEDMRRLALRMTEVDR